MCGLSFVQNNALLRPVLNDTDGGNHSIDNAERIPLDAEHLVKNKITIERLRGRFFFS